MRCAYLQITADSNVKTYTAKRTPYINKPYALLIKGHDRPFAQPVCAIEMAYTVHNFAY